MDYCDRRGEPVLATPYHVRLAERHPEDPAVLAAAAHSHQLIGAADRAHGYATRALDHATDPALRRTCLRYSAEALDAVNSFAEAVPIWVDPVSDPGADPTGVEIAYARALRLRGRHLEARRRLSALVDMLSKDPALFHDAQAAQIDLAHVELETDSQFAARRRAYEVLRAYHERELAYHRNAAEAGRVFAGGVAKGGAP